MTAETAVVVIGAGGHGKVVVATLQAAGLKPSLVLDDDPALWGGAVLGIEIAGPTAELHRLGTRRAVLAVGGNRARGDLAVDLAAGGDVEWVTAVHPAAVVDPSVSLGPGTVVFAGAIIQPDTTVGAHVIVNTAASVDHDCRLGDFVHVAPGARLAGGVEVGEGAFLGIGCRVLPGLRIGAWATVGAGATVTHDVSDGWTVVGSPARPVVRPGA